MKYNIKELAIKYSEFLTEREIDVSFDISQSFNLNTYNEYTYIKLMHQLDMLYNHIDSLEITEKFLKGD